MFETSFVCSVVDALVHSPDTRYARQTHILPATGNADG